MTAALGTVPTTAERVSVLERLAVEQAEVIAALTERIAVLEDQLVAAGDEDGPTPQPLPPNWKPIKAAAALVGRSESALLKAIKRHRDGVRWWRYDRGRVFANIDRLPWPVRTRT
jgi:hypothetical protein